ncbi:MAG: cytochrome c oxidase assembly factor Coa1 family protein [Flavobacterium circumlabens]|uniref:cytochrome c oxidase assembly factor Coa1 family protein n=1 Tax=Flavobacterium circumlabens TaxID=2133765 RepID=UPI003263B3DE
MDNDVVQKENWIKKNWKWFSAGCLFVLFIVSISVNSGKGISDMAQAYTENSLYKNAIHQANSNTRILEVMGEIKPIDKLAIIEGNASYSNNNNSVDLSVRIEGSKGRGKLNISAIKKGTEWEYKKITVRTKNSKEEITVLQSDL